jgi:hypothetical protein
MARYYKKPIVVNAVRNDGDWRIIMDWLDSLAPGGHGIPFGYRPPIVRLEDGSLNVETREGVMRADVGDYIICGIMGEFYPCKPDIFEATYEEEF